MNIFILSWDVKENARWHCDKHVRKMILESTQMLSNALYYRTGIAPYKPTHMNHPCSVWARMNISHWIYLRQLALALCDEYEYRWGKVHACREVIEGMPIPRWIGVKRKFFCKPPLVVPDDCKKYSIPKSYRLYYLNYKRHILKWTKREVPEWAKNIVTPC